MIDDRLREELNALLDGELPEGRAAELRRRIEAEPDLAAEYDRLRRVASLVRGLPAARADLAGDVMARLPARGRVHRPWGWMGALAAAAAAVMATVALWPDEPAPRESWTEASEERPAGADAPAEKKSVEKPVGKRIGKAEGESAVGLLEETEAARDVRKEADESEAPPRAPESAKLRGAAKHADLMQRVEKKGKPLTPEERDLYLRRVASLTRDELRAHFARVGDGRALPTPRPKGDASAEDAEIEFDLRVASAEQAAALRRTLSRAYRAAGTAKSVAPTGVQAEARDQNGGSTEYRWDATPEQLGALVIWLERIGLPPPGGVRPSRLRITGEFEQKAKKAPTVPVRVRIRYGDGGGEGRSEDR